MSETEDNIGYIELWNGKTLVAHKKKTAQKIEENKKDGHNAGNEDAALFFKNAYFLWRHRKEICEDSRMFLAKVRVSSGTSISGCHSGLILGTYIEFWETCEWTHLKDKNGNDALLCKIDASGLSGANICKVADKYGNASDISIKFATDRLRALFAINRKYSKCYEYEAYTLEEVIERLQFNDNESNWPLYVDNIQLFIDHREEIYGRKEWFLSPLPLSVYMVKGPIAVGTMLKLWEQENKWFFHKCDNCGQTAYIYSFAGNPLTGTTSVSYRCCHCSADGHARTSGFLSRAKALADAKNEYQKNDGHVDGIPLGTLVSILEDANPHSLPLC